ncbi:MAG: PorV/PorQ family protein [Bacteroidales bacterium]|nr:PorV/PorQ family protein [Bacteroidales bacterium]
MKYKYSTIALVAAVLLVIPAVAARAQEQGGNLEAFTFLRLDRSPVTSAMAGAGFSTTNDNWAYGAFGNPAAAAFMNNKVSAAVNYRSWGPGILDEQHITAAFAVKPIDKLAISAGFTKGIQPVLDESDPFRANDNIFSIGLSYRITDNIALGLNGHYAFQELVKDYKLQGFAFDVIGHYHGENFNVAGGAVAIGPKVVSEQSGAYPLPSSAKIAGDYTLALDAFKFTFAADADYYFSGNFGVSGGASVSYADMVFLRTGARYASANAAFPSHMAIGGGFKYSVVKLDVSYIAMNPIIGNSLMGGITLDF